jgi:hypothetical protein
MENSQEVEGFPETLQPQQVPARNRDGTLHPVPALAPQDEALQGRSIPPMAHANCGDTPATGAPADTVSTKSVGFLDCDNGDRGQPKAQEDPVLNPEVYSTRKSFRGAELQERDSMVGSSAAPTAAPTYSSSSKPEENAHVQSQRTIPSGQCARPSSLRHAKMHTSWTHLRARSGLSSSLTSPLSVLLTWAQEQQAGQHTDFFTTSRRLLWCHGCSRRLASAARRPCHTAARLHAPYHADALLPTLPDREPPDTHSPRTYLNFVQRPRVLLRPRCLLGC